MKTLFLLLILSFILSLNSFGQAYEKLKDSEVNKTKIEVATKFATDYLTAQKNGSYYQFKDEAVDNLKNALNEQNQKAGYKMIKDNFGDFKSLQYVETWLSKNNPEYQIIRLKGEFDKSTQKLEIRVILDSSNKIAGFWVKPWVDALT
jgi:uncharacterized protein YdeI (BOF family)